MEKIIDLLKQGDSAIKISEDNNKNQLIIGLSDYNINNF